MVRNCTNLEYICTKGWIADDKYKTGTNNNQYFVNDILSGAIKLKEIDLSFYTFNYLKNGSHGYTSSNTFNGSYTSLTYIRYGSGWFNATLHNIAKTYICTYTNLTKKHYDDMIEDLPDLTGVEINETNKTINIGENWNDSTKFPQTLRDKITAKGWNISKI